MLDAALALFQTTLDPSSPSPTASSGLSPAGSVSWKEVETIVSLLKWAMGVLGTAILFLVGATWRARGASEDANKRLAYAEKAWKALYGDTETEPPKLGLLHEFAEMKAVVSALSGKVKAFVVSFRAHSSDPEMMAVQIQEGIGEVVAEQVVSPAMKGRVEDHVAEAVRQARSRLVAEQEKQFSFDRLDDFDPFPSNPPPAALERVEVRVPTGGHKALTPNPKKR